MPVRLVAADDWRLSSTTERRLRDLEKEGILRPRASSTWPEWVTPPTDHREPNPSKGYVVSFAKFHHHSLRSPQAAS